MTTAAVKWIEVVWAKVENLRTRILTKLYYYFVWCGVAVELLSVCVRCGIPSGKRFNGRITKFAVVFFFKK